MIKNNEETDLFLRWAKERPEFGTLEGNVEHQLGCRELLHKITSTLESEPYVLFEAYDFIKNQLNHSLEEVFKKDLDCIPDKITSLYERASNLLPKQPQIAIQLLIPVIFRGCWLQQTCRLPFADTSLGTSVLKIFDCYINTPTYSAISDFYEAHIESNYKLPPITTRDFYHSSLLCEQTICYGLTSWSLSFFPRSFLPELIGYNLWHAAIGNKVLDKMISAITDVSFPVSISDNILECSKEIFTALDLNIDMHHRLWKGFQLAENSFTEIIRYLENWSIKQEVENIVSSSAVFAVGNHSHIIVEGQNLDSWLKNDVAGLINQLEKSSWISPGNPADSKLIKLFDFSGPMFGVLNVHQLDILKQWISEIGATPKKEEQEYSFKYPQKIKGVTFQDFLTESKNKYANGSFNKTFADIINHDICPLIRPIAYEIAQEMSTEIQLLSQNCKAEYAPNILDEYLKDIHKYEISLYESNKDKSYNLRALKEQVKLHGAITLTDGSWMQGACDVILIKRKDFKILYNLFFDEMGGGNIEWNHPILGRKEMASVEFALPHITSVHFVDTALEHFTESDLAQSFKLYCLGMFPRTFTLEILGFNFASEPSGASGSYRLSAERCKKSGILDTNYRIHSSIDNLATGHAHSSKIALEYYMANLDNNKEAGREIWQRLWTTVITSTNSLRGTQQYKWLDDV